MRHTVAGTTKGGVITLAVLRGPNAPQKLKEHLSVGIESVPTLLLRGATQ